MRIGIDAKWYFNGHPSGKVVVENLVNHLIRLDDSVDFFIYLDKRDEKIEFPIKKKNVHLVYVYNFINAFTNFFILPFYTQKDKLDICLYQNYSPLWGANKRVNYVHDALFMDFPQFFSYKEKIYFFPMKYLSKWADHVITISNSEKERMLKYSFTTINKISVVHHGLGLAKLKRNYTDDEKIAFRNKYNLPEKFILYLGRLNARKNILNLLKAIPYVNNKLSLVIVGKSDHKEENIDLMMKKLNLTNRVKKVGFIPQKDVFLFYSEAEIFCFPSYAEGFGLPPLEAMYYGTPVVVSNTTSLPEVCLDAAIYIVPDDYIDIANQINKLTNNKEFYYSMIAKGRKRVEVFSWEKASRELLSILYSVYNEV